jgi:hypothetical protein
MRYVQLPCTVMRSSLTRFYLKVEDVFICNDCDLKDAPCFRKGSSHLDSHPLLRYHGSVAETKTTESKIHALETKIEKLEKRFDDRLNVIEDLLRSVIIKGQL